MTDLKEKATEELILDAAMQVFTRKGFAAARMEEIAKEAGINRALLHYYYRDKKTMFNIIFETRFKEFFEGILIIFQTNTSLLKKIKELVDHDINTLSKHPDLPRFVIGEIARQPERLIQYGQKMNINPRILLDKFDQQVKEEVGKGIIKPIEGRQLLMNIMSLCIYPFVAKPILKTMMQFDENTFLEMMEKRKKEVYEFIISALKP